MDRERLPPIVASNVERWRATDDAWRGYHVESGRIVVDARVETGLRLMVARPGGTMLDIGCANGILTRLYAQAAKVDHVFGVDFVDLSLDPEEVTFRQANLDTDDPLPFEAESFDVVTCMETLEHLHDTDHIVSEIKRLLRPSGYAVIAVPRLDALLSIAMLAAGFQPPAIRVFAAGQCGDRPSQPQEAPCRPPEESHPGEDPASATSSGLLTAANATLVPASSKNHVTP